MPRILLDTNILLYVFDFADVGRQERAIEIVTALEANATGCLSVQGLAEFANVAPRKLRPPLSQLEVEQ